MLQLPMQHLTRLRCAFWFKHQCTYEIARLVQFQRTPNDEPTYTDLLEFLGAENACYAVVSSLDRRDDRKSPVLVFILICIVLCYFQ